MNHVNKGQNAFNNVAPGGRRGESRSFSLKDSGRVMVEVMKSEMQASGEAWDTVHAPGTGKGTNGNALPGEAEGEDTDAQALLVVGEDEEAPPASSACSYVYIARTAAGW